MANPRGRNNAEIVTAAPGGHNGLYAPEASPVLDVIAAAAVTANRLYMARFSTTREITIASVSFSITGAGNGNVDVAILDKSGNRLGSAGTTAFTGTGTITVDLTADVTLEENTPHYAAIIFSSTPTVVTTGTSSLTAAQLFGAALPDCEIGYQASTLAIGAGPFDIATVAAVPLLALNEA